MDDIPDGARRRIRVVRRAPADDLEVEIDLTGSQAATRTTPTVAPAATPAVRDVAVDRPATIVPKLFISYRWNDTSEVVARLAGLLKRDIGDRQVFRDRDDLLVGEDFDDRVIDEIRTSDATIVAIGDKWVGAQADGPPRIADPDDLVRQEVATALREGGRSGVLPVLVDTDMPSDLPREIAPLRRRLGIRIAEHAWKDAHESPPGYQDVLLGVWNARRVKVEGGVIAFDDGTPTAAADLAALLDTLRDSDTAEVRLVTRYACGTQVLGVVRRRLLRRRLPHVIAVIDRNAPPDRITVQRIEAARRLGLRVMVFSAAAASVAVLPTVYATLVGQSGVALGTTAVSVASPVTAVLGAAALAVLALVAGAVLTLAGGDRPDIRGAWDTEALSVRADNVLDLLPLPPSQVTLDTLDPGCGGPDCLLVVRSGPDFLVGAQLAPGDDRSWTVTFDGPPDELVRQVTGGGIECAGTGTETTSDAVPSATVRAIDANVLELTVVVTAPDVGGCRPGTATWVGTATRVAGG